MNFEFNATYVDLQDIPSYSTSITLEGQLLQLSFTWNERLGKRTLYIKNSTDVCYLQNKILFPNESLELNSNAVFDDLPYKVVLQKVGDIKKVGNFLNWSKDFILCFYRTIDEEEQKLIVRYGVTEPSTPTLPPINPPNLNNDCVGATKSATVGMCTGGGILEYFIDNVSIGTYLGRNVYDGSLESHGLRVTPIKGNGSIDTGSPYYDETRYQKFENVTTNTIRVKVETVDANNIDEELSPLNPTVVFNTDNVPPSVEFCLLPIADV